MNGLQNLLQVLERGDQEVFVDPELREKALQPLQPQLGSPRPQPFRLHHYPFSASRVSVDASCAALFVLFVRAPPFLPK